MSRRVASPELLAVRAAVDAAVDDLPTGTTILVACSGGPDSLALAGATAWVAPRRGLLARVLVVDHGLQEGSAAVAVAAAEACRALGLAEVDVVRVEVGREGGPEAAAREARYAALRSGALACGAMAVLLGHTRDDQAETVLMRLARGSGARSLSGMRPRQDPWRRPLLDLPRSVVHAAAAELLAPLGLSAWTDPHNADLAFARVRVRGLMDDLSDALGPGVALGLARSAELLRDDADALDALADLEYERLVRVDPEGPSADCAALAALPRALRTRVIRGMGLAAGCPGERLGHDQVAAVEALVVDWHGQGGLRLPGRVEARRECGRLLLHRT